MDLFIFMIGFFGLIGSVIVLIKKVIKKESKKKTSIIIGGCFVLMVVGLLMPSSESKNKDNLKNIVKEEANIEDKEELEASIDTPSEKQVRIEKEEGEVKEQIEESYGDVQKAIPKEHQSALKKAKMYSDNMHMSKAGLYDQLVSEYGEKFSEEAAQYAIDNVEADWKENALQIAIMYQDNMDMSPNAIYDQLVSEYGEKFSEEEARYAVDNLPE